MEEKKKIQAGKAYESLSDEERKQIVGFTEEQHTEMRARYGKRLKMLTVQVDEDERYDFLLVRPTKDTILAMASVRDDLNAANELLQGSCPW